MNGRGAFGEIAYHWVNCAMQVVRLDATSTSGALRLHVPCALTLGIRMWCRMPCVVTQVLHTVLTTTIMMK